MVGRRGDVDSGHARHLRATDDTRLVTASELRLKRAYASA